LYPNCYKVFSSSIEDARILFVSGRGKELSGKELSGCEELSGEELSGCEGLSKFKLLLMV